MPGRPDDTDSADCRNWNVSASWSTGSAVSGIYIAVLKRIDTGGASHIVFVVRDDSRQADIVVQTSDTTWQAYNQYGGGSLYCNGPVSNAGTVYSCTGRATKVSYNRPVDTRAHDPQSFLFNAEYPMVRWLEANGYDVKYIAGVDTERTPASLLGAHKPKAFLSIGHDEYWSAGQRAKVEAARDGGVNLAFFSGNEMYWKTRWEASIADGTPYRTLVSYKETLGGANDGSDARRLDRHLARSALQPAGCGRRPSGERPDRHDLDGQLRAPARSPCPASMANAAVLAQHARRQPGAAAATSPAPTRSGYEWDEDLDNGSRPAGLIHLSSTTVNGVEKILDYGETVGIGTATHHLTLYRARQRRARVRRRHRAVGVGARRQPRPRRRAGRSRRCSRRR